MSLQPHSDGPIKFWLHRYPDKEARLSIKRVIGPAGVGLSLSEMRELRAVIDEVEATLATAPNSAGAHDSIDIKPKAHQHGAAA